MDMIKFFLKKKRKMKLLTNEQQKADEEFEGKDA